MREGGNLGGRYCFLEFTGHLTIRLRWPKIHLEDELLLEATS